ncbi:hypothetical protein [uncultured Dubosiella sp.]|uniref:hypothetical protein n=1 Tax=uncultured Dubosiella sp. TaxID=1937011 RepID=UPI0025B06761|nr:hypothetical protein [uncultured Dubosiella sp.]
MMTFTDSVWEEVREEMRVELRDEVKNEIRDEISQAVKIQLAQKMLARNLPIEEIAENTELSIEQVKALQK